MPYPYGKYVYSAYESDSDESDSNKSEKNKMTYSIDYRTTDGKICKMHCDPTVRQSINLSGRGMTKIVRIVGLTDLRVLSLRNNKIGRIEGFEQLVNLRELYLENNQIERIEGLDQLTELRTLNLSFNKIGQIKGLDRLTNLMDLFLSSNKIGKINGLDRLTNLRQLSFTRNQIRKIEGIDQLSNLQLLVLWENPIEEVPFEIMNLRNLHQVCADPVKPIDPIIQRFLRKNLIKTNRTIYNDPQNVHDRQIHRSISGSLHRLMDCKIDISDDQVVQEIIDDPILTQQTKQQIVEYTKIDDVHSMLNVTFMEALRYVWQAIRSHEQADSIKKVLDQEMQDSICRCFTGRLSRLVNCLSGFDDRVEIKISSNQEISNLIILIKQKYDNSEQQIKMVREEMTKRGYDQHVIDEWVGYLE
jgi:hypothetical protein